MPTLPIGLAIGAIGGNVASSLIGARAAGQASRAQAGAGLQAAELQTQAGTQAAELQAQSSREALDFQQQMFSTQQENFAPWLQAGQGAIGDLSGLLGIGGQGGDGSLLQPFGREFVPPTGATMQNDPGFQFRLQEGLDALQNSAAARGGLLTGATGEALTRYAQDYASGEYGNVYNRALTEYQTAYNAFQQGQANQFNRLASVSGLGQTAAGQLGGLGQYAAGNIGNLLMGSARNVGNILMGTAGQVGESLQNAAAARASGYTDRAQQFQGGIQGGIGNLSQLLMLQSLLGNQGSLFSNQQRRDTSELDELNRLWGRRG